MDERGLHRMGDGVYPDYMGCQADKYAESETRMTTGAVLEREGDRKRFVVVDLAHWSRIRSEDGEENRVKWIGGDEYVGWRGPGFKLLRSAE